MPVTGSSRLSELLRDDSDGRFPRALTPRQFRFPEDHGAHEAFRNEWWYFTGNLDASSGRRVGYELTLFRFAVAPALPDRLDSAWQTNQVYIGHFAVTDVEEERFYVAERYARGAAGLAGVAAGPLRIWLDDWRMTFDGDGWTLSASDEGFAVQLQLAPLKALVLNGDRGLSRKSAEPGNASYYYSVPRLRTTGSVRMGEQWLTVSGLSWLDREWGSSALSAAQRGWDWFALQLSDGSDVMMYQIRRLDGEPDDYSSGTFIAPDGRVTRLSGTDFSIGVLDVWESESGTVYPAAWRLEIPGRDLSLRVRPVIANQELVTNVRYWEGAVDVSGQAGDRPVTGRGYVELTGYAEP